MIQLNGLALAYLGDAYYELEVRKHLLASGITKVDDLHKEAIRFTSARGQSLAMDNLEGLSDEEVVIYKRGRNAESTRKPKNTDLATYHNATGFEALIGYLYLSGSQERLDEIVRQSIDIVAKSPE